MRRSRRSQKWAVAGGAKRRALINKRAENGMYRYKRIIGDALRSRRPEAQKKEAMIAVNVINKMTTLGMPRSVAIVQQGRVALGTVSAAVESCNNAWLNVS
ncbi:MAG: hypothetical protein ACI9OJ_002889 [Myxococcota bacterium]|jgi:hypothetical protein